MDHIKNLKIVITAGASGIGAEIAKTLSEAGAQVIICAKDQHVHYRECVACPPGTTNASGDNAYSL